MVIFSIVRRRDHIAEWTKSVFCLGLLVYAILFDQWLLGWTHLEVAAANYGPIAKRSALCRQDQQINEFDRYMASLDQEHGGQLALLFWTLDQLVARYGDDGIFHINDRDANGANNAVKQLQKYADLKGYQRVVIAPVIGDFRTINPAITLQVDGRQRYDSVHLKNLEPYYYQNSRSTSLQVEALFQKIANLSVRGCYLFLYHFDRFKPVNFGEKGIKGAPFYNETSDWDPIPYISRHGAIISSDCCKVFFIESLDE